MQAMVQKAGSNQKVPQGGLILAQGDNANMLVLLNQGTVTIRSGDNPENPNAGKYVYSIQGPAVLGGAALAVGGSYSYSAIAASECVISSYASNRENLLQIFASKPNIAILYLRSAYKDTVETFNKVNSANTFMEQLIKSQDALSLAFSVLAPEKFQESADEQAVDLGNLDPVLPQARIIVENYREKGGSIAEPLTAQFMRAEHSAILGTSYEPEAPIDRDELNYLRRMVSLPANIQSAIAQKDATFVLMSVNKLGKMQAQLMSELDNTFLKIQQATEYTIVGQNSWLEKIVMNVELFQQNLTTISHNDLFTVAQYLHETIRVIQDKYKRVFALPLPADIKSSFAKLTEFLQQQPEQEEAAPEESASAEVTEDTAGILKEMAGQAKKVFQWVGLPNDKFVEFQKGLASLKELKNPLDHEGDARKLRRGLNNMHWELYEAGALKFLKNPGELPTFMKMYFNFGLIDETLLEDDQNVFLYKHANHIDTQYPIFTAIEWLQRVFTNESPTSINELGLTMFEILKQENRDKGWKRESDLPPDVNSPEARVKFEIKNMIAPTTRLTSGSILNHFAILSKYTITQNILRAMVSKDILAKELDHLLKVDFSAFHREVLFEVSKETAKREFIQLRVLPNVVLVPSAGPVCQAWQDREGKNRTSPGRLMLPSLAMADLFTMLLQGVGALRWETVKTILGPDWNNISKSSLTADYTDYVQFFKKNRDLSPEAKEKLSAEFKRFRDDRQRFVNDYQTWVKYESEGTQRFNKVARKIFAKHIPFSLDIRDKLLKLPSYTDIIQKSINIRKRKARELEPRYKKYRQDNNGVLAPELVETHKFYNMEY